MRAFSLRDADAACQRGDLSWFDEHIDLAAPPPWKHLDGDLAIVARVQAWAALMLAKSLADGGITGYEIDEFADQLFPGAVVAPGAPDVFRALMPAFIAAGGPCAEINARSMLSVLVAGVRKDE